jgi:uncharacterized protein (TIGR00251 family)
LHVQLHVQPGAKVPRVGGSFDGRLSVKVRARAVEGAATDEVLTAVAEAFCVRTRDVSLVRGALSRLKTVDVIGEDALLASRLDELLRL